jgi:hypothetical protein
VVSYDRLTGAPDYTLGDVAGQAPGTSHESFHFVLNDTVVKDNRIPPYGMAYETARQRNALPVPATQYGPSGGVYDYFDQFALNPPSGATYATIDLLYQGTSWEYIQFLNNANSGQNAFLGQEGVNLLEAWLNTGMAEPFVMASATWGNGGTPPPPSDELVGVTSLQTGLYSGTGDEVTLLAQVADGSGQPVAGATVTVAVTGPESVTLSGSSESSGQVELSWQTQAPNRQGQGGTTPGTYSATVSEVAATGYLWDGTQRSTTFTLQ